MEKEILTKYRPSVELYERIKNYDYGEFLTYEALGVILGKDPQGEGRSAILTVRNWLLERHDKLLLCKPGEGYYIGHPNEHVDYSRSEEEAGGRKIKRALKAAVHCAEDKLTAEERSLLLQQQLRSGIKTAAIMQVDRQRKITEHHQISLPSGKELMEICRRSKSETK